MTAQSNFVKPSEKGSVVDSYDNIRLIKKHKIVSLGLEQFCGKRTICLNLRESKRAIKPRGIRRKMRRRSFYVRAHESINHT